MTMSTGGIRVVRNVSAGAVAAIAAWSSYSHTVHVALAFGERPEVAYALPASVDGMLVVASVVMADDKRRGHRVRPIARLAFTAGVLASVAANIAAAHPDLGARIVAAWPAVALLLVVEMLTRTPRRTATELPPRPSTGARPAAEDRRQVPPPVDMPAPQNAAVVPPTVVTSADVPPALVPPAPVPSACVASIVASPAVVPIAAAAEVPEEAVPPVSPQPLVSPTPPVVGRVAAGVAAADGTAAAEDVAAPVRRARRAGPPPEHPAGRRRRPAATTRQLAHQIIAAEPHLTRTEVAARLGVSTRRLREVLTTPT